MTAYDGLTNPFPGLRPFESNEDHLFFGRDGQSDELLRRLRRSRFLAVLGTSGSGKSSLVRAGLLPSLYGGLMTQAGSGWRVALFRPGQDPIANLARALNAPNVFGSGAEDIDVQRTITEATLRRSALGLVETTRQARMPSNENLLVVVDQFEEIFRFRRTSRKEGPEDEAAAFIKLLLEAKRQTEVPIYIVMTMRSDFLGDCSQFRDLPEAINDGQYLIPRMTRDQRREAISGPVAVGGAEISGRLVNRLLNDVGDDPDHLPILQHALMRTWDFWTRHRSAGEPIDLRHYEAVGTMADALSRHADEAYNELPDQRSRAVAEKLFKGLTEKGPDNREIRRPSQVKEICAITEASTAEIIAVIEPFRLPGRSFLMPPANVTLGAESLIDISHESLIRGWERLREWVDEEARSAQIYRRLAETAALHAEGKAGLWHDPDLALALKWREDNKPNAVWAQHYHPDFDAAMAFLDGSVEARDAAIAEKERRRKQEMRRTRIFATVLGVAFLMSAGFGVFAYDARNKAYTARNDALDQRNKAEAARSEAVIEKQRAQESEEHALASEQRAQTEQQRAEQAAKIAEQRQQEALAASQRAQQAQELADLKRRDAEQQKIRAERLAGNLRLNALKTRSNDLNTNGYLMFLIDSIITTASPEEAAYWHGRKAAVLAQQGDHEGAITESTLALDGNAANLFARMTRSDQYLTLGRAQESLKDLDLYTQTDPNSSLAYLNMGLDLGMQARYSDAVTATQMAIDRFMYGGGGSVDSDVSPDIYEATGKRVIISDAEAFRAALFYELATLEAAAGGADAATRFAAALQRADEQKPSADAQLNALNWAAFQLKYRPDDYGVLASRGALWERGDFEDRARRSYGQFLSQHENRRQERYDDLAAWVRKRLTELNSSTSLRQAAGALAQKSRKESELKLEAASLALESREMENGRNFRSALEALNKAIALDPTNVDLLLQRADLSFRLKDQVANPPGVKANPDALMSDSIDPNALTRKAVLALSKRDADLVLKLVPPSKLTNLSYGLKSAPDGTRKDELASSAVAYYYRARATDWAIFTELGVPKKDEVIPDLRRALALDPTNLDVVLYLASELSESNPDEALDLYKRFARMSSISSSVYQEMAKLQNAKGRYQDALESIRLAITLQPDNADYYEEREKSEEGLHVSEAERQRHLAAGYVEIGDIRLRQLKTSEARQAYEKSLQILSGLEKAGFGEAVSADLAIVNAKLSRLGK